jgi:uncharacterized protein (TIGR02679 family)
VGVNASSGLPAPRPAPHDAPHDAGSAGADADRLARLLGDRALAWFVERIRGRLARSRPLTGAVTLATPSDDQRDAVERLLGRRPREGRSLTVRLDDVDAVLRRSGACPDGLAAAVTALTGPVTLLRETREGEERAWQEAYAPLRTLGPELAGWSARMIRDGLVRRLARTPEAAGALLDTAVRALRALPAELPLPLPVFAARTLGDAHALDEGRPLATLVFSGARVLTGFPDGAGAAWRREAWAAAGLLSDDLASTVLILNLRGTPALDWMAGQGEPAVLTLRQLTRFPPDAARPAGAVVHVCENPAVLAAAADTHGASCPPMVCLQGQPSVAALHLLRRATARGAAVRYHGDFDWGGLRIAGVLWRHVRWQPWRYTAEDYRAAVAARPGADPLTGTPTASPWDPLLADALADHRVRVEEEAVLDALLADLAACR